MQFSTLSSGSIIHQKTLNAGSDVVETVQGANKQSVELLSLRRLAKPCSPVCSINRDSILGPLLQHFKSTQARPLVARRQHSLARVIPSQTRLTEILGPASIFRLKPRFCLGCLQRGVCYYFPCASMHGLPQASKSQTQYPQINPYIPIKFYLEFCRGSASKRCHYKIDLEI